MDAYDGLFTKMLIVYAILASPLVAIVIITIIYDIKNWLDK